MSRASRAMKQSYKDHNKGVPCKSHVLPRKMMTSRFYRKMQRLYKRDIRRENKYYRDLVSLSDIRLDIRRMK